MSYVQLDISLKSLYQQIKEVGYIVDRMGYTIKWQNKGWAVLRAWAMFWSFTVISICIICGIFSTMLFSYKECCQFQVEEEHREYSMGVASVADSTGITLAGIISVPVHNLICDL